MYKRAYSEHSIFPISTWLVIGTALLSMQLDCVEHTTLRAEDLPEGKACLIYTSTVFTAADFLCTVSSQVLKNLRMNGKNEAPRVLYGTRRRILSVQSDFRVNIARNVRRILIRCRDGGAKCIELGQFSGIIGINCRIARPRRAGLPAWGGSTGRVKKHIAGSSNGRTHASGACYLGSNPSPATNS